MRILVVVSFIFIIHPVFSQSKTVHNPTWIIAAYQNNFDVKEKGNALNIRFDANYRSLDWFKNNRQFILREITTWNFNDTWRLGLGPCVSWLYAYGEVKPVFEFRPTVQLTYLKTYAEKTKFKFNFFQWSIRLRQELRYYKMNEEWTDTYHRTRLAFKTNIPIKEGISFTPQVESMWQQNPGGCFHFSALRIFPSINFGVDGIQIQIGYMFQFLERGMMDEMENNFIFSFSN